MLLCAGNQEENAAMQLLGWHVPIKNVVEWCCPAYLLGQLAVSHQCSSRSAQAAEGKIFHS